MKKLSIAAILFLGLGLTGCQAATVEPAPAPATVTTPTATATPTATCQEDEPCWDCATMGNKVCGPVVTATPTPTPTETVAPVDAGTDVTEVAPEQPVLVPIAPVAPYVPPVVAKPIPQPTVTVVGSPVIDPKPVVTTAPTVTATKPIAPVTKERVACSELKPGDGGTTRQHNCTDRPVCPNPTSDATGALISPPNAPKECFFAQ